MTAPAAHAALFDYPERTALGRPVPKSRIYAAGNPSRRVRDRITAQVAQIVWQYKLAPETLKLPATRAVPEIQVFTIALKPGSHNDELPEDILRGIDKAIGFPILFELTSHPAEGAPPDRVRVAAGYKRPSEAEAGKWVTSEAYFATGWLPAASPRAPLPLALDLGRLYEQLLHPLIPAPARPGETMAALVERQARIASKLRECRRMEARVQGEKQFNRKVELNRQLRLVKQELEQLMTQ